MKNFLIIICLAILGFTSCGKYEEGPALSLRSKTDRLCGSWEMSACYVDDMPQENSGSSKWEIKKNGDCSRESTDTWTQTTTTVSGTWAFNKDKTQVDFQWVIPALSSTISESWTILKLKEKELWIETDSYGSTMQIRFDQ